MVLGNAKWAKYQMFDLDCSDGQDSFPLII